MKSFFGEELNVGDIVFYTPVDMVGSSTRKPVKALGRIEKFTNKKCYVTRLWCQYDFLMNSYKLKKPDLTELVVAKANDYLVETYLGGVDYNK